MLLPIFENRFKKDIKRLQKRNKDIEKLKTVIDKLLNNQPLDAKKLEWIQRLSYRT